MTSELFTAAEQIGGVFTIIVGGAVVAAGYRRARANAAARRAAKAFLATPASRYLPGDGSYIPVSALHDKIVVDGNVRVALGSLLEVWTHNQSVQIRLDGAQAQIALAIENGQPVGGTAATTYTHSAAG